jgi:proteic killer suppression protein
MPSILESVKTTARFAEQALRGAADNRTPARGGERQLWPEHNAQRYARVVIRSFRDSATERLWSRQRAKGIDRKIERTALRKLVMLDAAETLDDLRVPPGNRLEALKGDRAGQHSIRINQQWRICFVWTAAGPDDVDIVDYH